MEVHACIWVEGVDTSGTIGRTAAAAAAMGVGCSIRQIYHSRMKRGDSLETLPSRG